MRILWLTNSPLQPIREKLGLPSINTGGWMLSSLNELKKSGFKIYVASIWNVKSLVKEEIDGVTYFLLPGESPMTHYDKDLESLWVKVNNEIYPDVVHFHGSEYQHGQAWINACGNGNVVLSIQGIISSYERYFWGGLETELSDIKRRNFFKRDFTSHSFKDWHRRSLEEVKLFDKVKYFIGRTEWDKAHVWALNRGAKYFFCGETMRPEFYNHKWKYEDCNPYSIFLSQSHYQIKGLHKVLDALPLVLDKYPDTEVYLAGKDIFSHPTNRYATIIKQRILDLGIKDKIHILGSLTEKGMCDRFLKSNVFICPSSIENSSNSIGEAQLLGMPIIASYVGGTPEIMENAEHWLYRFEETEMLAYKVCEIFETGRNFIVPEYKLMRYDPEKNLKQLEYIYGQIVKENKK